MRSALGIRGRSIAAAGIALTAAALFLLFAGSAAAAAFGVASAENCQSPVDAGAPYTCEFVIENVVQGSHDTVEVDSLVDVVKAASGRQTSGNLLDLSGASLTLTGGASCNGTVCTLPFGATLSTAYVSFYTAQAADYPTLSDKGSFTWQEVCQAGQPNCNSNPQTATTASQASVNLDATTTSSTILNASGSPVTSVPVGATVTDSATVASTAPAPTPTGTVQLSWFTNGTCTGSATATASATLGAGGTVVASGFPQGPLAVGQYAFQVSYLGDPSAPELQPSSGPCEPLSVVDANISIAPTAATNAVGVPHTFTATVNVNGGSGVYVPAPDGTVVTFSIAHGPGVLAPAGGVCTTAGGTGQCSIALDSATAGATTLAASASLTEDGVPLTRMTGDGNAGDGPDAVKSWVDGEITIGPNSTNAVETAQTFTVTVQQNSGAGFAPVANVTVDPSTVYSASATGSAPTGTCYSGPTNASGQCTIVVSSSTAGEATAGASATWSITANGNSASVTRATGDGLSGDGAAAVKTWVDASITLSPLTATNAIGSPHTFTVTVNEYPGSTTPVPAANATVVPSVVYSGGATGTAPTGTCLGGTTNASGQCTIVVDSTTAGQATIHASTTLSITANGGSVSLARSTGDGQSSDSPDAVKIWAVLTVMKVCDFLTPTSGALAGMTFTFTIAPTVDNGATSTATLPAAAGPTGVCWQDPEELPEGSTVTVSEAATPDVAANGDSVGTAASSTITLGSGINVVSFSDQAYGALEICKNMIATDTAYDGNALFNFNVGGTELGNGTFTGGTNVAVLAGRCSPTMLVPSGSVQIGELANPNFTFVSASAGGSTFATDPFTVPIGFGGGPTETDVQVVNQVDRAAFVICETIDPGSLTALQNDVFNVSWTATSTPAAVPSSGTVALTLNPALPGDACSGDLPAATGSSAASPMPVVKTGGALTSVTVTMTSVVNRSGGAVSAYSNTALSVDNVNPAGTSTVAHNAKGSATGVTWNPGTGTDTVTFLTRKT